MKNQLISAVLNSTIVLILAAIILMPLFFAKNFTRVAGVKTESQYLIISQIDKFPNVSLSQTGNSFTLNVDKQGEKQAFLSVFILNNPTEESKKYKIEAQSEGNTVFYGEDLNNMISEIVLPPHTSSPISLYSASKLQKDSISFSISAL